MPALSVDSHRATDLNLSQKAHIPEDFPHPYRLSGADVFRALLNDASKSTFARWLAEGTIQAPVKLGGMNAWSEQYMAHVVRNGTQSPSARALAPRSPDQALR